MVFLVQVFTFWTVIYDYILQCFWQQLMFINPFTFNNLWLKWFSHTVILRYRNYIAQCFCYCKQNETKLTLIKTLRYMFYCVKTTCTNLSTMLRVPYCSFHSIWKIKYDWVITYCWEKRNEIKLISEKIILLQHLSK